jgi:hypothetical protein
MASGIAQMAPYKFSGRAMRWWNNLSLALCSHYSSSWAHLLDAIRRHFLTMKWLMDRTQEFEEMRFRQKGLESEDPLDFFQRRIESHLFIYNDAGDGPQAVACILRTQPAEWAKDINETSCPDVDALQNYAEHNRASLIASWLLANQVDALMVNGTSSRTNGFHRRRCALAADRVSGAADSESEEEEITVEDSKQAMAADQRRMTNRAPTDSKPPWPKGKTINGYEFKRNDSVVSQRPPKGECYICTSPKHYAHECPHHGRWNALRDAHLIITDIDARDEAQDLREYIAMLVECTPSSSYPCEIKITPLDNAAEPLDDVLDSKAEAALKEVQAYSVTIQDHLTVDALGISAKAAHIVERGYHRNRR